MRTATRLALAMTAGAVCLFAPDNWTSGGQSTLITQAHARAGRPLTPVSVAGVHRRTARRAYRRDYYGGGYEGGGYYGPGAVGAAAVGAAAVGAAAVGAATTGAAPLSEPVGAPPAGPGPTNYPDWAPSFVHDAIPVEPGASATVTDPATGRTCTIQPSGYHWCWTP